MLKLATINDLKENPPEVTNEFVTRAMQLSSWYDQWKQQDMGGYSYTVEVVANKQRTPGVHASEISKCPRQAVYTLNGTEPRAGEKNVNMQRRFNFGHALHAMTQKELELMCAWLNQGQKLITFEPEASIHPSLQDVAAQYDIHSSCDGVFTFWYQDEPYLRVGLEIKTKSAPEYEKLNAPEPAHLEQTCVYMRALDVPLMWLLYYNKSNSNYTGASPPYLFKFDEHIWTTKLVPRIEEFRQLSQSGELPLRVEGFHCGWCPYRWTCQPPSQYGSKRVGAASTVQSPGSLRIPR